MVYPTVEEVSAAASDAAFGERIIQNNLRSLVVETIIEFAISPSWRRCSGDWNGWDFEHSGGTRLEVKQSAALQTWKAPIQKRYPRFDIAPRKGYWIGSTFYQELARHAKIYVFAMHGLIDEQADHRDPAQWRFYVVNADRLPSHSSIGLPALKALSDEVGWAALFEAIETTRLALEQPALPLERKPRSLASNKTRKGTE